MRAALAASLLMLMLSGCDQTPTSASRDLAVCRRSADYSMGPDAAMDPSVDRTTNPMVMAERENRRDQYQTLVDQCLGSPR